ncbi:hypothetical protein SUGI_0411690 [Cryptomeria japonica]|nr:hypothetical protein SUGI_0411690 [Cryptomeria japonica]
MARQSAVIVLVMLVLIILSDCRLLDSDTIHAEKKSLTEHHNYSNVGKRRREEEEKLEGNIPHEGERQISVRGMPVSTVYPFKG